MKKSLTIFFCCCIAYSAHAQIANYNIANFVRPELYRATSRLNFSLNLGNQNNNIDTTDDTEYGIQLNGFFANTKFINNEAHQKTISNFINFIGSSNSGLNAAEVDFLGLTAGRAYSDKKFRTAKKFLEVGYRIRAQGDVIHAPSGNQSNLTLDLEIPVFLGKGRIEIVNDAWQALRILESLEKSGFLIKSMSEEDIEQLALEIGNIKNSRMTDPRLEAIYEYELLSKYMVENEIINPENYAVFATLNDAWNFENFTFIRSGKNFKYGLVPNIVYNVNSHSDNNNDNGFTLFELIARIEREVYKPIRKNVQLNYSYGLNVGARKRDRHGDNTSFDDQFIQPNISISTTYYPNARTNYSVGFSGLYIHTFESNVDNFNAAINGRYIYYASPQLTFNLVGSINLIQNSNDFQDSFVNNNHIRFSTNYRFY